MLENKRRKNVISFLGLILILLVSSFLGYYIVFSGHNWGGDFALYIYQTESLLNNTAEKLLALNTFAMLNSTQMPGPSPQIGPFLYPWGFPLLLLPVYMLFDVNYLAFKLYMLFYFLLTLLVVYFLFKKRTGRKFSLLIVALLAINPTLLFALDSVGSDIPYTFFAVFAILIIQKLYNKKRLFGGNAIAYFLVGLVMFVAFLIRTNGIVLLGTLFVSQLVFHYETIRSGLKGFLKKNWMEGLPYLTFFVLLIVYKFVLVEGSSSHLAFLSRVTPGKLAYNIMYYISLPSDFFEGALFPQIILGFTLPFLMLGVYRRFLSDNHYLSYSIFTLVIFIIWPPIQGLRFIFSVLPFYLYFTFVGFRYAEALVHQNRFGRLKNSTMALVFSCYLIFMFTFTAFKMASENFDERKIIEGPYTPEAMEMTGFVSENTDSSDVIIFFKPRVLNYLTRRPSIRVTALEEIIEGKGAYYVYIKNQSYGQIELPDFLEWYPDKPPVFENENFVIYALKEIRASSI